jgi:hypothetical protein
MSSGGIASPLPELIIILSYSVSNFCLPIQLLAGFDLGSFDSKNLVNECFFTLSLVSLALLVARTARWTAAISGNIIFVPGINFKNILEFNGAFQ